MHSQNYILIFSLFILTLTSSVMGSFLKDPSSSIQDSCQNLKIENATLHAKCKTSNGDLNDTQVNLDRCIANFNGRMLWTDNPMGFYSGNCQNCSLDNFNYKCKCQKTNGSLRDTQLDLTNGVINKDGNLKCKYEA